MNTIVNTTQEYSKQLLNTKYVMLFSYFQFQNTFDVWSKHISELRDAYPSLNYFTTDQLVTLSVELAQLLHKNLDISQQAVMLLNLVSPELNTKQLATVLKEFLGQESMEVEFGNTHDKEWENEDYLETSDQDDYIEPLDSLQSTEAFKVLCQDFDKDLVLAGLIETGSEDIDIVTEWCYENAARPAKQCQQILTNYSLKATPCRVHHDTIASQEIKSIGILFNYNAQDLISQKIKEIWTQFIGNINKSEVSDHLSFQALAKCLEDLSQNHGTKPLRAIPPLLVEGCQNLVVCSDAEMHAMVASFYMQDPLKPKPSLDEVLICESETPQEQIELLCRRAFNDTSGKIFVVMHAEKLSYDTGIFIETLFKNTTPSNKKYRLIFMAAQEQNEHSSYIVTAFEKNRRQMASPQKIVIKQYLLKHDTSQTSTDPDNVPFESSNPMCLAMANHLLHKGFLRE